MPAYYPCPRWAAVPSTQPPIGSAAEPTAVPRPGVHPRALLTPALAPAQVYIIGDVGIEEELDLLGIQHMGGPADNDKKVELKPGYAMPFDKDVSPSNKLKWQAQPRF